MSGQVDEVEDFDDGRKELDLRKRGFDDAKAIHFSHQLIDALLTNPNLTFLNMGSNYIYDTGAAALGQVLRRRTSLVEISFEENMIGSSGIVAFAEPLAANTCLRKLNLSKNQIGDEGAAALGAALQQNSSLTELGGVGQQEPRAPLPQQQHDRRPRRGRFGRRPVPK